MGITKRSPRITLEPPWSQSDTWRDTSVSWLIRFSICCGPNTRLCRDSRYTRSFPYTSPSFRATIHAARLSLPFGVNGTM